jgi:hypothetical protein
MYVEFQKDEVCALPDAKPGTYIEIMASSVLPSDIFAVTR